MFQAYIHAVAICLLSCVLFSCSARTSGYEALPNVAATGSAPVVADPETAELEPVDLPVSETVQLAVGETSIQALVYKGTIPGILLFNMHDDENTSVEAAKAFVTASGGTLVELRHTGQRFITFTMKGKTYKFDPNRIFTKVGVSKTLANEGRTSPEAKSEVNRFAGELVKRFLTARESVVAMHNNTEAAYSTASYQKGGEYENDAAKVYVGPKNDTDDFFYVTEEKYFDLLSGKGFNTVLQNNASVTDDGSLSVFCGQKQIRYINVEAQHGHGKQQLNMLRVLAETLGVK